MKISVFPLRAAFGSRSRSARLPVHLVIFAEAVGVVEGRVGEDVVGAEVGMDVAAEGDGGHEGRRFFGVHDVLAGILN